MSLKNPEGQVWRWLQVLKTYHFEIHHRPGTQHQNADGLSRRPCAECRFCERQEIKDQTESQGCPGHRISAMGLEPTKGKDKWCEPWTHDDIQAWQKEYPIIFKVLTWVKAGRTPPGRMWEWKVLPPVHSGRHLNN